MTAVVLLACLVAGTAEADLEGFFEEFKAKRDGIAVLEAEFTQKTILPDEILTTHGNLLYAAPRRIVFRTEDPDRTTLVDGRTGYEYEPEIKQLVIFGLEDNPQADIFFIAFDNDATALRAGYDVTIFATEDSEGGSRGLTIRPKADAEEKYFEEVRLFLRDTDLLPWRVHIVNDAESQIYLNFHEITVNGDPAPERSQIQLPEGVKIVEGDRVKEIVGPEGKAVPAALDFSQDAPEDSVAVTELPASAETP